LQTNSVSVLNNEFSSIFFGRLKVCLYRTRPRTRLGERGLAAFAKEWSK